MKKISSVFSLLFLIPFLLVSCEKSSSDWVEYMKDNDGNVFSYKKVNIQKDGDNNIVQVWEKEVYSDKGKEKEIQSITKLGLSTERYNKLSELNYLSEIDCKKRMGRTLNIVRYDTNGQTLESGNVNGKWDYIIPDSNGDTVFKEVCK